MLYYIKFGPVISVDLWQSWNSENSKSYGVHGDSENSDFAFLEV